MWTKSRSALPLTKTLDPHLSTHTLHPSRYSTLSLHLHAYLNYRQFRNVWSVFVVFNRPHSPRKKLILCSLTSPVMISNTPVMISNTPCNDFKYPPCSKSLRPNLNFSPPRPYPHSSCYTSFLMEVSRCSFVGDRWFGEGVDFHYYQAGADDQNR